MKLIITVLAFFIVAGTIAQKSNLIFYSENGEKFQVIVNGVLQNSNPETNVKITDLVAPNYQVKILFENKTLGSVDKQIYFNQGNETTYVVKKTKDGPYAIRFRSEVLLAQAPPTVTGQTSYIYSTVAPVATTVTQSQTTTTVSGNEPTNVSMGVNANGMDINFNMNVNDGMSNNSSTTSTYSTTTTTTTTTNAPVGGVIIEEQPTVIYVPGYSGSVGCARPVNPNEFESIKNTISSKSFEDSKLTIAKQVVSAKCLTCTQVKEIMLIFSFEASRLEFAKFAYKHTYDIENYYILNDAFTFESSIDELNSYINGGGN